MAQPLACPYCNALVPVPAGMPAGERVVCPRCEEPFVLRESVSADESAVPVGDPVPAGLTGPVPVRQRNRLVALVVLGGMTSMALAGLTLAWMTRDYRRGNDRGIAKSTRRPSIRQGQPLPPLEAVLAPLQLPALGYLPGECDVIAGAQVALLLRAPERALLSPDFKVAIGSLKLPVGRLLAAKTTGLEEVDHVVLGLSADKPLSALLVVRTRKPYDLATVIESLKAERANGDAKGRVHYRFSLQHVELLHHVQLPASLWCPDDQTLVFSLTDSALAAAPAQAHANGEQLAPEVRAVLSERVEPSANVWAVGHVDDWRKTALPALLNPPNAPSVKDLLDSRTLAAWLYLEKNTLTLRAALQFRDEAAAQRMVKLLVPPDGEVRGEMKSSRAGEWLTLQYRKGLSAVSADP